MAGLLYLVGQRACNWGSNVLWNLRESKSCLNFGRLKVFCLQGCGKTALVGSFPECGRHGYANPSEVSKCIDHLSLRRRFSFPPWALSPKQPQLTRRHCELC